MDAVKERTETKIGVMAVREYCEGRAVELWDHGGGKLTIRAYNQAGWDCVDLDLQDILDWAKSKM